jgi:uncharacterized phage protein (TIGR01671 family)
MRTIKFRAWDKEKQVMIYDDSQEAGDIYDLPPGARIHNTVWVIGHYYKTLMQFTGLHDKNNVEIYEGDILKIYNDDEEYITHVREERGTLSVDVINHDYNYIAPGWLDDWCILEIIGNIYQNPELLTDNKQ